MQRNEDQGSQQTNYKDKNLKGLAISVSEVFLGKKKNVYKVLGYAGLGLKTSFEPLCKIQWDSLL